jgi:group I intron endonuclease
MKKPKNGITGIYKITNPNGKVYIGKSKNVLARYYKYSKLNCKKQGVIYNSLKKYGPKNHKFDIIEECDILVLLEREIYYKEEFIKKYTWNMALFCHLEDGNSGPHTQSEDSNVKRSRSLKEYWSNNPHPLLGIIRSSDFSEKHCKPILQYDLDGNFIKEWVSQLEVYKILKVDINNCLKKRNKTSGRYQWRYKGESIHLNIELVKPKKKRTKAHCNKISLNKMGKGLKPILQLDLKGNVIKEWESQSKASKEMNLSISCINLCLSGRNKTSGGFKWIYKN